jgi:hypothetical protein
MNNGTFDDARFSDVVLHITDKTLRSSRRMRVTKQILAERCDYFYGQFNFDYFKDRLANKNGPRLIDNERCNGKGEGNGGEGKGEGEGEGEGEGKGEGEGNDRGSDRGNEKESVRERKRERVVTLTVDCEREVQIMSTFVELLYSKQFISCNEGLQSSFRDEPDRIPMAMRLLDLYGFDCVMTRCVIDAAIACISSTTSAMRVLSLFPIPNRHRATIFMYVVAHHPIDNLCSIDYTALLGWSIDEIVIMAQYNFDAPDSMCVFAHAWMKQNNPCFETSLMFVESLRDMEWHETLNRYTRDLFQFGTKTFNTMVIYNIHKKFQPNTLLINVVLAGIEFNVARVAPSESVASGLLLTCVGPRVIDTIGITGELHMWVSCDSENVQHVQTTFRFAELQVGATHRIEHGAHVSDTVMIIMSMSDDR